MLAGTALRGSELDDLHSFFLQGLQGLPGWLLWDRGPGQGYLRELGGCRRMASGSAEDTQEVSEHSGKAGF